MISKGFVHDFKLRLVSIILLESNVGIDTSTEDWTDEEIANVTNHIQYALDWWVSQNPNANVSFTKEIKIVRTSYETYRQAKLG